MINMHLYNLDLANEYEMVGKLNDLIAFFEVGDFEYKSMVKNLKEMKVIIKQKILGAVKIWGSVILRDPYTEFDL